MHAEIAATGVRGQHVPIFLDLAWPVFMWVRPSNYTLYNKIIEIACMLVTSVVNTASQATPGRSMQHLVTIQNRMYNCMG
jgi:hypothetical protein